MLETRTGNTRLRSVVVGAAFAFSLTSCGSSGESDRDQAISALDRTTSASALETEMASLVAGVPDDPNAKQGQNINASVEDLDNQAETILASTGTGKSYDEKISAAVNETRGAGNEITSAVGQPDQLGKARTKAIGHLTGSNRNLKEATGLIGKDLADEQGNLSSEDALALKETKTAVDESAESVISAGAEVLASRCLVRQDEGSLTPIKIEQGEVDCVEAAKLRQMYWDSDAPSEGSGLYKTIGEWSCGRNLTYYGQDSVVETTCYRLSDNANFVIEEYDSR